MKKEVILLIILLLIVGCAQVNEEVVKGSEDNFQEQVKIPGSPLEGEIDSLLKKQSLSTSKYEGLKASLTTITGLTDEDRARIKQKLEQLSEMVTKEQLEDKPVKTEGPNLGIWRVDPDCKDIDVKFTHSPIALEKIEHIGPVGALTEQIAGHVVPNDHGAISYQEGTVDVIMPADGFLTTAERHQYTPPPGKPNLHHYHLYFELSCSLYLGLIHITSLDPAIIEASEELKKVNEGDLVQMGYAWVRIPIKAGQKIGTATEWRMMGIIAVDTGHYNTGYTNPKSYEQGQPWRLYGVSPFDYFEEPLKIKIFEKIGRTAEPRGGKAGYDIPGKLIGAWFMEGTNGMAGLPPENPLCGNMVCSYWYGHFSIVPDAMKPEKIRIQFGYDLSETLRGPYGIKGNAPDPSDIGVEDGLVKYELVSVNELPDNPLITENDDTVVATMLIEMIDDMTVKIEPFIDKTASEVNGFTDNAKVYVR